MISRDIIWYYMILHDITWYYMILHDITWYYMILHDITWYYIILHYITWYYMILHDITWYYMILHDITWYYMILHDITYYIIIYLCIYIHKYVHIYIYIYIYIYIHIYGLGIAALILPFQGGVPVISNHVYSYLTDNGTPWVEEGPLFEFERGALHRCTKQMETCEAARAARGASSGCLWQLCGPAPRMNRFADLVQIQTAFVQ